MAATLPSNVYVSKHPCLRAKLSQLRSKSTNARETKTLVTEIATILGVESLASLEVSSSGTVSLFCQLNRLREGSETDCIWS